MNHAGSHSPKVASRPESKGVENAPPRAAGASIYLHQFQRRWREGVGAPLKFVGPGRAELPDADYPRALWESVVEAGGLGASDRLGAYRMQYWFRMFTLLQRANPLLGHLIGWERFNPLVSRFLADHPAERDLSSLGEAFPGWLATQGVKRSWLEAAQVDRAWEEVFEAAEKPRMDAQGLERVAQGKAAVELQPSVRLLRLGRDWVGLRTRLVNGESVDPGLPDRKSRWWVLSRTGAILQANPVDVAWAEILGALGQGVAWEAALEEVAARRGLSTERIRQGFAQGQQWGLWSLGDVA